MAFSLKPRQALECCSCIRRLAITGPAESWTARPIQQQIRGKKKLAKDADDRLKVRLLRDIPKYGRKGAIVPLPRGLMRNLWYPSGKAEYVTDSQLKELNLKNTTIERDVTFVPGRQRSQKTLKKETESPEDELPERPERPDMKYKVQLLDVQRAMEILSAAIPPSLIFYRSPITATTSQKKSPTRPAAASSAAADLAAASEPVPKPEPVGIYGSVSNAEIATSVRALLVSHEEGSRIVVSAEDISFVTALRDGEGGETDRVRHLGDFEIEIKLKGASQSLKRTVSVLAEEKDTNAGVENTERLAEVP